MNSIDIRQKFLDFFKKYNHTIVPSSPLIPADDPTLLFANAGMNQFKDLFLGKEKRSYKRATSSQKCVRAGGKHNDLDEVGFTNRHLTFFEMLGNFSFGDYFKKEAIHFAWEFLTKEVGLDPKTLCVSVYKTDDESFEIWNKDIGIEPERIYRLGEEDNFWQMGDTGPCGPCTEIHVDKGKDFGCKTKNCDPSCSCGRFIEVWNLVFMQYDRQADGRLNPLTQTGVDTGMGLERLTMILQNKDSIFHTDLFEFLIKRIEELTGKKYDASPADPQAADPQAADPQAAFHVLCDHVRSSCLLIADGCSPSNEGRGYVLRKIIRRAALFAQKLTDDNLLFSKLAQTFIEAMSPVFQNLKESKDLILKILESEIKRFATNLSQGRIIFAKYADQNQRGGKKVISGEQVFKLYDTYGFPPELTRVMALEEGFSIDMSAFEVEMEKQRAQSGKKQEDKSDAVTTFQVPAQIQTRFTGYDSLESKSKIIFVQPVDDGFWIATQESPFYVESGGQVGDSGFVTIGEKNYKVEAVDKISSGQNPAILLKISAKDLKVGDTAHLVVDYYKRKSAEKNHTSTHLLQASLMQVLGKQVKQLGSLVCEDYLRFDFSHHEAMTREQIEQVEQVVNQKIQDDIELKTFCTTLSEAQEQGVTAFFGEKYDPECVRVVQVPNFSAELCGGTHVKRTGEIGCFKIISESALATGTRRIVAQTGPGAVRVFQQTFATIKFLSEKYKVKPDGVLQAVRKDSENHLALQKEFKNTRKQLIKANAVIWSEKIEIIGDIPFLFVKVKEHSSDELRLICQEVQARKPGLYFLISIDSDSRIKFVGYVSKDFAGKVDLRQISKELKEEFDLRSGGKPDFIQGGGVSVDLGALESFLRKVMEKQNKPFAPSDF
jgi:alanyl-tRNA synthetase